MKLKEITPAWLTDGGVFKALYSAHTDVAWLAAYESLDIEYYGNRSGDKRASPLLEALHEAYPESALDKIAALLWNRYSTQWGKLWATADFEYKPLENYNMIEKATPDITRTRTPSLTEEVSRSTDITTATDSQNDSAIFGFNSSTAQPQANASGATSQRMTGSSDTNRDIKSTSGTEIETETGTRELTRSGNIGVTTSQQMMESEIDLWSKWDIVATIFRDVDKVMTCHVYE